MKEGRPKGLTNAYNDVVRARHRLIGLSKKQYLQQINALGVIAEQLKKEVFKKQLTTIEQGMKGDLKYL